MSRAPRVSVLVFPGTWSERDFAHVAGLLGWEARPTFSELVREMVRVIALSITVVTLALRILRKFSRIRSNTTTDSLTE